MICMTGDVQATAYVCPTGLVEAAVAQHGQEQSGRGNR
jgi:hypothetical protein